MVNKKCLFLLLVFYILFLVSPVLSQEWSYYVNDHLGNTRAVLDETGNAKAVYDYHPFGLSSRSIVSGYDARYKFTGKELDDGGGLDWYYFGARYYDASIGRWLVVDPLHNTLQPNKLIAVPDFLNSPYAYVNNRPLVITDPDGNCGGLCVGLIILSGILFNASDANPPPGTVPTDPTGQIILDVSLDVAAEFSPVPGDNLIFKGVSKGLGAILFDKNARNAVEGAVDAVKTTPTDRLKGQLLERPGKPKSQSTLRGAQTELAGGQTEAAFKQGKKFDHVTKVRNAQRGLVRRIEVLKGKLSSLDLSKAQRTALQDELSQASKLLDKSEEFVPRK